MKLIEGVTITFAMLGAGTTIAEPASGEIAYNASTSYAIGAEVVSTTTHRTYVSLKGQSATVTISNASPGVVTWASHGLAAATGLSFTTTGALPTGLTAGQVYYVVNPTLNTFQLAATPTGTPINTSSAGSGVHTAVISTNLGNTPEASPLYWQDKGPSQKMAPFDTSPITKAKATTSLVYEITPGVVYDAIGIHGLVGATSLRIQQFVGAVSKYDQTFPLDASIIDDWWDYWFAPIEQQARFARFDLYPDPTAKIILTFTGGSMEVGIIEIGQGFDVGKLIYGARMPRKDYSKKEFDDFGRETIVARPYSRQISGTITYDMSETERVARIFDRNRATPCTWVGVEGDDDLTEPLTLYGFWRTFDPAVENPTKINASIAIEGLSEQ